MCIVIACPPGRTPDYDNLISATFENQDGSGWMMKTPQGLEVVRSAHNIDHVVGSFWNARRKWPDVWAVWHSRLATHGTISDVNTHPFVVPGQPWAMVHNGIMPLNDGPFGQDRSDSRIFAEDHLSTQHWEALKDNQDEIERWLEGDKVVLLSGQKERGGSIIIFNEHLGKWDATDDCWYSHPLYGYGAYKRVPAITASAMKDDPDNSDWFDEEDYFYNKYNAKWTKDDEEAMYEDMFDSLEDV